MKCLAACLESCTACLHSVLSHTCPFCERLLWSKASEYRVVKALLGFCFGAGVGAALYYIILIRLPFTEKEKVYLGGTIGLLLSIGFAFSVQVRCTVVLVTPYLFSRYGRNILTTMTMTLLITGPVANIFHNAEELSRSISCTAALAHNNSELLFELMHQPFTGVMDDLKDQSENINEISHEMKQEFIAIEEEVEDDKDGKKYKNDRKRGKGKKTEDNYKDKLDYRCKDIFEQGVEECKGTFRRAERDCRNTIAVPVVKDVLCSPMKLTFLCNIVTAYSSLCDTDEAVNPGMGKTYQSADEAVNEFDTNFEVAIGWQVQQGTEEIDLKTSSDIQLAVSNEFKSRSQWITMLVTIIKSIIAFNFVLMFLSAHSYSKKFISEITFDNVYITSYFRKIENRRKQQKKRILLPLKKAETKEIVIPTKISLLADEKRKLGKGVVRLLLNVLVSLIICTFDYLLFHILDIVQRHSEVTIQLKGVHAIRVKVHGEGAIAHLFRTMLSGFNSRHELDSMSTNTECLPYPNHVPNDTIYTIFIGWGIVFILLYVEAYGLRLRRVICSFFFPKVSHAK
ncbi:E3 ubiquitin-protein ligase DCST1-like, partial [Saccoglossus kowalevskii]